MPQDSDDPWGKPVPISSVELADGLEGLLDRLRSDTSPRLLAGGTDLLLKDPDGPIIDITRVPELHGIEEASDGIHIGAAVSLSEVTRSDVVASWFPALASGARQVAGPQIRNLATLVGNVCNASPSADTVPPLLVYEAVVEVRSASGSRAVPVREFFLGPGRTVLEPGELVTGLRLPRPPSRSTSSYTKVSPRRAMDLAVVGVAVRLSEVDASLDVAVALGAVAPTPIRVPEAERVVTSAGRVDASVAAEAGRAAAAAAAPIDDVRGSARYRRAVVERVVARDLVTAAGRLSAAGDRS